jgi:hypothetical protein
MPETLETWYKEEYLKHWQNFIGPRKTSYMTGKEKENYIKLAHACMYHHRKFKEELYATITTRPDPYPDWHPGEEISKRIIEREEATRRKWRK